jgi:RNA recognition motif-containing protein
MKLYVGNLSYDVSETDLETAFEAYAPIVSVSIFRDKRTGESRGFGFVEMSEVSQGQAAIESMNGTELKGREIVVDKAKEKAPPRRTRSAGFGPRGGGRSKGGNWNR